MENKQQNNSTIFWRFFWGTIIILLMLYLIIVKLASYNLNETKIETPQERFEKRLKEIQTKLIKKEPEIAKILQLSIENSKEEIKDIISKNMDKAFEPLYAHIEDFTNFHYSVKGEYTELASLLLKQTDYALKEYLFKPANFNENIKNSLQKIHNDILNIIQKNIKNTNQNIKNILDIKDDELNLITKILTLSEKDTLNRFDNLYTNIFRVTGAGIGAGAFLGAKVIAKTLSKKITAKIIAKTTIKAGAKTGAKFAGVGGGAATGAEVGSIFGPVGAAIGGVAGAIAGWLLTDKIVVEIDRYLHGEEFKQELKKMINTQKEAIIQELYQKYEQVLTDFEKEQKNTVKSSIEKLKNKKIKDLIYQ